MSRINLLLIVFLLIAQSQIRVQHADAKMRPPMLVRPAVQTWGIGAPVALQIENRGGQATHWGIDSHPIGVTFLRGRFGAAVSPIETARSFVISVFASNAAGYSEISFKVRLVNVIKINEAWLRANGPAPYALRGPRAYYLLETDVSTPGTAFFTAARNITLDLGKHTVTYDDEKPIEIENWSFENGTGGWDFSDAPDCDVREGNYVKPVQVGDGKKSLVITLPPGASAIVRSKESYSVNRNRPYAITYWTNQKQKGIASRVRLRDTTYQATKSGINYRTGTLVEGVFRPNSNTTAQIEIGARNRGDKPVKLRIDNIQLKPYRRHGIVATQNAPGWHSGVRTIGSNNVRMNFTLKNGTVQQGQAQSHDCTVIMARSTTGLTVDNVTLRPSGSAGATSSCIFLTYAKDWTLRNTRFNNHIRWIRNRDQRDGTSVIANSTGGTRRITQCTFDQGPITGIEISTKGNGKFEINNNLFRMTAKYTNGFAIQAGGSSGNTMNLIHDNRVEQHEGIYCGRGIHLDHSRNVMCSNNKIENRALPYNQEYDGFVYGGAFGIELEGNCSRTTVTNNEVTTYAIGGSDCAAFRGKFDKTKSRNNKVIGNRFTAIGDFKGIAAAARLKLDEVDGDVSCELQGNTFRSNDVLIASEACKQWTWRENRFEPITPVARNYKPFIRLWSPKVPIDLRFVDNDYASDTIRSAFESLSWPYLSKNKPPRKTDTVEIAWTTTVQIDDGTKKGRLVEIVDAESSEVRESSTTGEDGRVSFELDQLVLAGGVVTERAYDIRIDGVVQKRKFTPAKKSTLIIKP